ncbi:MAG: family 43 glycosylhydrolase [Prevotella sp.]|nr:family 43 glycosylhydrolase [Prevotella sp.]
MNLKIKFMVGFLLTSTLGTVEISAQNMPLVQTKYTADSAPMVYNDTVYLYTTHDEDTANGFEMYDWLLYTSTDMVNWTDHGAVASTKDFVWRTRDNGAWAMHVIARNGKFYMYCPLHGHGIGVLVSDTPYGPFKDPIGKPIVWDKSNWYDIDPSVWIDDDGQAYMYWGNPYTYYARLNDDMVTLKDSVVRLPYHIEHYQEGPWFYKRKGHYYLAFASTCCPEAIGYAMSESPTGPWTSKGYIMRPTDRSRGNHPGIIDYKGHSYVFGLNYDIMHLQTMEHHERRSVSASEITYNADGTIQEVPYWLDQQPLKQLEYLNPYRRVEAETMNWGYGLKTEKLADGRGIAVTNIDDGEYIRLRGVDFGKKGARRFIASVAATYEGTIELRLDGEKNKPVGLLHVKATGGTDRFQEMTCKVKKAKGVHDLYLCFKKNAGKDDMKFDYWKMK